MKKRWFMNGKRVIVNGRQPLCEDCPNDGDEMIASPGVGWKELFTARVPANGQKICWKLRHTFADDYYIAYNGSYFLAIEINTKAVFTSADLDNWTQIGTADASRIKQFMWLAGRWIMPEHRLSESGHNAYPFICSSSNGISWTTSNEPGFAYQTPASEKSPSQDESNAAYYYGSSYTPMYDSWYYGSSYKTTDYIDWDNIEFKIVNLPSLPYDPYKFSMSIKKIIRANGKYYGTGSYSYVEGSVHFYPLLAESTDAINWTDLNFSFRGVDKTIRNICYNGYLFVLSYNGYIYTSPDAVNWTQRYSDGDFYNVTYLAEWSSNAQMFVLQGSNKIHTSPDGINWSNSAMKYPRLILKNTPYSYPPIGGQSE